MWIFDEKLSFRTLLVFPSVCDVAKWLHHAFICHLGENFNVFGILAYELPNRIFFSKKSDDFFFFNFFPIFGKVLDDSQWQVHLRRSNIYSKYCYMFLTYEKHHKFNFLANLGIFKKIWLFSESFGYFLRHSYQICLFWHKIWILQLILDYTDISNRSLGELGL
jgi:hypothetical protein